MKELKPLKLIKQSDEQFSDSTYKWLAECGCGKQFLTRKRNVEKGETKSCGCFRKMNTRARRLLESEKRSPNDSVLIPNSFYRYSESARIKGLDFTISFQEFEVLVTHNCHYCDAVPNKLNGVDRLDSDLGYTVKNCVACCSSCNYLKSSIDYSNFVSIITKIYLNLKRHNEV